MSEDAVYEVMIAGYADTSSAAAALETLKEVDKSGAIEIIDAAVIAKDSEGKVKVVETAEFTSGKGAMSGAAVGAVIGVIFPPAILASALIGGAVGALVGKFKDTGLFDNTALKEAAEGLPADSSAIVAVVEDRWMEQLETAVEGYDSLATHALDAEFVADIMAVEE